MGGSVHHHDESNFYCVKCVSEGCDHLIPLLQYEPERQRRNPAEFRVQCPLCGKSNLYNDTEVQIGPARRIEGFVPVKGLRNMK